MKAVVLGDVHGGQMILAWGQWQHGQVKDKRGVFAWLALESVWLHTGAPNQAVCLGSG